MRIDTLLRHFREAYRGVKRNTWMSFAAISAVAVTLFIFGLFLLFTFNVSYMTKQLDKQVAITVSLPMTTTEADRVQLEKELKALKGVKKVDFVSKQQGLHEIKEAWGEGGDKVFAGFEDKESNPIPDIFKVQPQNPAETKKMAEEIKRLQPRVEDVEYADTITDKLLSFSGVVRNIVLAFGVGLAILAAFLVSNTIRLTIMARKREIEIQRLVGASNWFIRWPFFIEGVFIGIGGAILPIVTVIILYQVALSSLGIGEINILKVMPLSEITLNVGGSILLLGTFIGMWGSLISVRRFLRI
jgi:cell division transport system permease protein